VLFIYRRRCTSCYASAPILALILFAFFPSFFLFLWQVREPCVCELRTLRDVVASHQLPVIDLLKVDVEGAVRVCSKPSLLTKTNVERGVCLIERGRGG
jgi:hypothetical protein